jgi:4-hydroxy-tetrahydrodipicolinate reductase
VKTTLGINGVCGRMGLRVFQLAHQEERDVVVGAALERSSHPAIGKDVGEIAGYGPIGLAITAEVPLDQRLDALIDFSTPAGTLAILQTCVARRIPLVVATTGFTAAERREIDEAAHETAILMAPNMSLAMNVLMRLLSEAASLLKGKDFDVEILERHHRYKKDAPSGTALHLAKIVQEHMGQHHLRHGREGLVGERPRHEIGIHAIRTGDNVGEHVVIFSALGETLELTHRAHTRDCYVRGAIQAAKYLAGRPAGTYAMKDVLGL